MFIASRENISRNPFKGEKNHCFSEERKVFPTIRVVSLILFSPILTVHPLITANYQQLGYFHNCTIHIQEYKAVINRNAIIDVVFHHHDFSAAVACS